MNGPPYDLVVFGATSFVGQILTQHLAEHLAAGTDPLSWAIAGRTIGKLEALKASLGARWDSLPILVADMTNEAQLQSLCTQTRVVASTVGPYALLGEPLLRACVQNGTDYCDLAGEAQWIKQMIDKYEELACQSGARILHCCGFDSVPSDMGVYFLQREARRRWQAPATRILMRVKRLRGGASGGTIASILNLIQTVMTDSALRQAIGDPYFLCRDDPTTIRQRPPGRQVRFDRQCQAWSAPFLMAPLNEQVVYRTNTLLGHSYGNNFAYDEALLTGAGPEGMLKALGVAGAIGAFMIGAAVGPLRYLMQRFLLPKPGEGPTLAAQLAGGFELSLLGFSDQGEQIGVKISAERDPGYGATGRILGQAAISLALDLVEKGTKVGRQGGFWTPASCFDERYIERLERYAGVHFELLGGGTKENIT